MQKEEKKKFTRQQKLTIVILALLQFLIILDFMVLSPLGAIMMKELEITTARFSMAVSVYAFSACAGGLVAAGFADMFDRKKLLVLFTGGFILGTLLCAMAPNYEVLVAARIFAGGLGGIVSSVSYAIITDLFEARQRGRAMGFFQMAFGASQVLGIPVGLFLANRFGWHSPFWLITLCGMMIAVALVKFIPSVAGHLNEKRQRRAIQHLKDAISNPGYLRAFLSITLLTTGGFMLIPLGSAYGVHNLGLKMDELPVLYGALGVFMIIAAPLSGKLCDSVGPFRLFVTGSVLCVILVRIYTTLGITPLWSCIAVVIALFTGVIFRQVSAGVLMSMVPETEDRGAFMSLNSAFQQISGGIASYVAGLVVTQSGNGQLEHYSDLGNIVIATMILSVGLMYWVVLYLRTRVTVKETYFSKSVKIKEAQE
ncbi:MFS transporter [Chitinophaga sp. 22536]|uniref:MFS transporter n=1 Tax=unclassified Chitinophaga TaxID=2619133 RepID=UPI003F86F3A7